MKKGLLSIHYYFPPMHSIGVLRNAYINNALHIHFDAHTVLTTSNRKLFGQDDSITITPNIKQIELPTNDYRTKLASRKGKDSMHMPTQKKKSFFRKLGIKAINSWPINLWQGEGGRSYIKEGIKIGKKRIEAGEVTHLYTSFRPYADHYIAYKLKLQFPQLIWIADFRDLHIDPLYNWVLAPDIHKRINKSFFKHADALITVTPGYVDALKKYNPNVHCIFNGIYEQHPKPQEPQDTRLTFTYTGSLYGDHRSPAPLIKAIREAEIGPDQCQIVYAGKDATHFSSFFQAQHQSALLNNYGEVSRTQALQLQSDSDVLLLLSSSVPGMQGILTGKFFEYMAAGKPIWLFMEGIKDPYFENLFKEYKLGQIFYAEDEQKIKTKLASYLALKKEQNLKSVQPDLPSIQRDFSWEHAANEILKLC